MHAIIMYVCVKLLCVYMQLHPTHPHTHTDVLDPPTHTHAQLVQPVYCKDVHMFSSGTNSTPSVWREGPLASADCAL